jgi:hypothetical protein
MRTEARVASTGRCGAIAETLVGKAATFSQRCLPVRRSVRLHTWFFPQIPEAIAIAGTLGGALVATMKAPIFSALFVMVLMQRETSAVIAIAVVASALATAGLTMRSGQAA